MLVVSKIFTIFIIIFFSNSSLGQVSGKSDIEPPSKGRLLFSAPFNTYVTLGYKYSSIKLNKNDDLSKYSYPGILKKEYPNNFSSIVYGVGFSGASKIPISLEVVASNTLEKKENLYNTVLEGQSDQVQVRNGFKISTIGSNIKLTNGGKFIKITGGVGLHLFDYKETSIMFDSNLNQTKLKENGYYMNALAGLTISPTEKLDFSLTYEISKFKQFDLFESANSFVFLIKYFP